MRIFNVLFTLALTSNLIFALNHDIKSPTFVQELDEETKTTLEKYIQYNNEIQHRKIKINIVEEISNLKFSKSTESLLKILDVTQNMRLIEISHGLAREYIKKVGVPKPEEATEIIRKQYFLMKEKKIVEEELSIILHEVIISKDIRITNHKLDLANLNLNSIEGILTCLHPNIPLSTISKLEQIDLSGNNLEKLPEEILYIKQLKILNLRNNKLKHLPQGIQNLQNLLRLDVSNNELKTLPDSMKYLKNLWFLGIQGNPIENIPESISELENLWIH